MKSLLFTCFLLHTLLAMAQHTHHPAPKATPPPASPKAVVKAFLAEVRSGRAPEKAALYMAPTVLAHQVNAEDETTVQRSPGQYADHIREFLVLYGNYAFEVTELIAEGDKVYARWKQTGKHLAPIDGHAPTGKPLVEIASAVYRLENGKIAEYWIQIDRLGLEAQLKRQAR
jgi:predicted ester cyclase